MSATTLYISGIYDTSTFAGGWACITDDGLAVREFCGGSRKTSANRMTLLALIHALQSVGHTPVGTRLSIITDSKLLADGLGGKVSQWKAKGWRTKAGQWIPHNELWRRVLKLLTRFEATATYTPQPDSESLLARNQFLCKMGQADEHPLRLFVDGSFLPDRRAGGWGVVIDDHGVLSEASGFMPISDNNAIELIAVIRGLEMLEHRKDVIVYTDSQYVCLGAEKIVQRREKNWRHPKGIRVDNYLLWKRLDNLMAKIEVRIEWIKGHSGIEHNETADRLAGKAARFGISDAARQVAAVA
jgi:ribonuclease HI